MVYSNKFVMCVLVGGQVMQEKANGTVTIPFGSEYVLRFRNKNDRRGAVKFKIDGEEASGNGYVIPANGHVDIERYADRDVAFKFVDLDSPEAVDAGKNGSNEDLLKGVVEASFQLEKAPAPVPEVHNHYHTHSPAPWSWYHPLPTPWVPLRFDSNTVIGARNDSVMRGGVRTMGMFNNDVMSESVSVSCSVGDALLVDQSGPTAHGCTVEGGATGQTFQTTYIDLEDAVTVLKLFLIGQKVKRPTKKVGSKKDDEIARLKAKLAELEGKKKRTRRKVAA